MHNPTAAIVAEPEDFYRSSQIQLDGDHAPRTNIVEFRNLPPGSYQVKAMLIGTNHEPRASLSQQINVISNGGGR